MADGGGGCLDATRHVVSQGMSGRGFIGVVPGVLGASLAEIAVASSGRDVGFWFIGGTFFGGFLPLYLMPWLRRHTR